MHLLPIDKIVSRSEIRSDQANEMLNKMTDEELNQWKKENESVLGDRNIPRDTPEWNIALQEVYDYDYTRYLAAKPKFI